MIQLLFELILALLCSYLVLIIFFKYKLKIKYLIVIGLCFYMVEIAFYVYLATKVPEDAIPVTPEEMKNPR